MRVGISTFGCDHGKSGIGSYVSSMIKNLPAVANVEYVLFGHEIDRYTYESDLGTIRYEGVTVPDTLRAEKNWYWLYLNSFIKKHKFDAVIYPAGIKLLPFSFAVPGVVVINEVLFSSYERRSNPVEEFFLKYKFKKATKIVAASQFIRKNLVSAGIKPESIEVIHNGINHSHFYPRTGLDGDTVLIKPFSIKRPFIIYASKIRHPIKKHVELIRAFSLFKKKTGLPHRLVIAGADGDGADLVHREVARSAFSSDIFLTGYFPHENLPELYSCADACIFPSVLEGVGLPVIEAMATGIPVACAKAGALTEIAGDNALYFNPDEPDEFALAIETIITDTKLREKLIKTGIEWTQRFSWDKTALKTIELVQSLCNAASNK